MAQTKGSQRFSLMKKGKRKVYPHRTEKPIGLHGSAKSAKMKSSYRRKKCYQKKGNDIYGGRKKKHQLLELSLLGRGENKI